MTSTETPWSVEFTRQAEGDLKRLKGVMLERTLRALALLEADPYAGQRLSGTLTTTRSLHFSLPGSGQYRAAYACLEEEQTCLVFLIASWENFYRTAERRWNALRTDR